MKDPEFWFNLEAKYPRFGGEGFKGYRALHAEHQTRIQIERALRTGDIVLGDRSMTNRRFLNVVKQEERRINNEIVRKPCSCEASFNSVDE